MKWQESYTEIFERCAHLVLKTEFHNCKKYPIDIITYDIHPYIGFKCKCCDHAWGIHKKNFKKTLKNNLLLTFNLDTLNSRLKWAKQISEIVTEEIFCKKFQRNFLNYVALIECAFGGGQEMLQQYQKLPFDTKQNLCNIAFKHIELHINKTEKMSDPFPTGIPVYNPLQPLLNGDKENTIERT